MWISLSNAGLCCPDIGWGLEQGTQREDTAGQRQGNGHSIKVVPGFKKINLGNIP